MRPYMTNRNEAARTERQNFLKLDPLLHTSVHDMDMNQFKRAAILKKLRKGKQCQFDKLVIDPVILGRYMNFNGASSEVAKYLKGLEYKIRKTFISDDPGLTYKYDTIYISPAINKMSPLYRDLQEQIDHHNITFTMQMNNLAEGKYNYGKMPKLVRSPQRQRTKSHATTEVEEKERIHATPRGRILKPAKLGTHQFDQTNQPFNDFPKSVPLCPINRAQLYQLLYS